MAEKDFEKDVVIGKVYKGKGGESQHGPWQIWNFYLKDPDDKRKFTWFEKDGLIPIEGMSIKAMEFEIEVKGEYTNHTVKWFKLYPLSGTPNTPQKSTQSPPVSTGGTISPKDMSFYQAYAKDIFVALVPFDANYQVLDLEDAVAIVAQCGKIMHSLANGVEPEAEPEPYKPTLNPDDDYPPIGEPPPL